jgi:hypothetical protein
MITQKKLYPPNLLLIREALEASWDEKTSYLAVKKKGNPALGQCSPTARVVQHFFPKTEIVKGKVWNGSELELHFWNVLQIEGLLYHIDLSWQQFPPNSSVREFEILDRSSLNDSQGTLDRCALLLSRVIAFIEKGGSTHLAKSSKYTPPLQSHESAR